MSFIYRMRIFIISMTLISLVAGIFLIFICRFLGISVRSISLQALTLSVISCVFPSTYENRSLICIWFKNSSLPRENLAPDLLILLMLNCSTICYRSRTSLRMKTPVVSLSTVGSSLWGGFHPSKATPLRTASGKKSLSLYDCTETSPNLFDSFWPLSFSNSGKWANSGISSYSILYRMMCFGVDGSHS